MQVCKRTSGSEQRGRLIGKGPLPKEKIMKALGEVSSRCEIFLVRVVILFILVVVIYDSNDPFSNH